MICKVVDYPSFPYKRPTKKQLAICKELKQLVMEIFNDKKDN